MADLKGAVRMTVEYSDGSKTVVNYNPISGDALPTNESPMEEEVKVEAPVEEAVAEEVVEEVAEEAPVEEAVVEPEAA